MDEQQQVPPKTSDLFDDQTLKNEDTTLTKSVNKLRICLVGDVCDDSLTVEAAKTFELPVITSETGSEFIPDDSWTTYFVMKDFDSPIYDAIYKSKHKIIGPPALQQAVQCKEYLPNLNRPVYNYSMRGVVTCFTGIRKKDELTKLVHLIHCMGGSIRRDLNTKITHLICNTSGGTKYHYANTFRLAIVRPNWVFDAWEKRNDPTFSASVEEFSLNHKLKAFEGQRICFFGFSTEEKQHMIDILIENNGIPTDLEDPECSHVIMSNTGANFPDNLIPTNSSPSSSDDQNIDENNLNELITVSNSTPKKDSDDETDDLNTDENDEIKMIDFDDNEFIRPNDISPILPIKNESTFLFQENRQNTDFNDDDCTGGYKRKLTDSASSSFSLAKKPKLARTGSISKGIRRKMSFAIKTPISKMLRSRNDFHDPNLSISSISSITSIESTFNESIKKPIQEKFRGIKERFTRSSKKDVNITPKSTKSKFNLSRISHLTDPQTPNFKVIPEGICTPVDFKTPTAPKSHNILRHSICGTNLRNNLMATTAFSRKSFAASVETDTLGGEKLPVVDDHTVQSKPETNGRTHILKADWFWYTIQNGYANEMDYQFGDYLDSIANTPGGERRDSLPVNLNKRKRKRFSQRFMKEDASVGGSKRRSSVSDAGLLSISGSFLDATVSPDKHEMGSSGKSLQNSELSMNEQQSTKNKSMRFNHFTDFYQTESNYVGILDTIVTLFKQPLEEMSEGSPDEALLNKSEIKAIFSNFLSIHHVHKEMLNNLRELQNNWTEECLIGKLILDNRNELIKAYPPYINFFEQMREQLIQCDTQKPRFHAFLKINQAKPECGRQSFQDLMIRPVQRLPSISLLLNDILKHTPKNNPDHQKLEEALRAIKEVMTYINEDKRKTEGQLAMFDIFNDIDNCPPHLVSSHRVFVSKCEVTELSDNLSGRGDSLILFLFSDTLEVCKKRSRGFGNSKSPSTTTINNLNTTRGVQSVKPYKHIKFMPLSSIRFVIDVKDSPRAFALNCRLNQEAKEKLYSFSLLDEEIEKLIYIKSLLKQMAEHACRADAEKCLMSCESHELNIDISDVNHGTLSKAFKFATRTRLKVGRAFSFNKTPSKLKKAVGSMMTSPFGSTNSLTPASQLAQMRLASCTHINELGEENSSDSNTSPDMLVAPMSVQPTRKNKNPSLRRF